MTTSKTEKSAEISVMEITRGVMDFNLVGVTPIILNRLSEKARGQLLLPSPKKNAAEKASTLKHDPYAEFRSSPYTADDESSPTLITHLATAFKNALRNAALDMPGAAKSQIGRLTYISGDYVPLFGLPKMLLSVVRSADMNRTPDVRSRVIIPKWAARVSIEFVKPILREQAVANLFAAAGITQGVGDWRPQKGAGGFGQFRLASADDEEFAEIVKFGGRAAQVAAMADPLPYDKETSELLSWYGVEVTRRGFKSVGVA